MPAATTTTAASYRSLYTYPWDILDQGVARFVEDALALGMRDVTLATSYHAGKFLRPHAASGPRVIFPEDGVVYFEPNSAGYGQIQAHPHSNPAMRAVLPQLLADGRLRVHGWTVLLHNSRIGAEAPQYCAQNAFGDRYLYSLCPMQSAVFEYALNLCRDLSGQHALTSLVLETPGWLPYAHGYHHEFAQLESDSWQDTLLGLCFCDACLAAAQHSGIDGVALQQRAQQKLAQRLAHGMASAPDQAATALQADLLADPDLARYIGLRQARVTQLVTAIRQAMPASTQLAVIPTVQRPTAACWREGSDLAALAKVADFLEIPFYEPNAARVLADAVDVLQRVGRADQLRAILRPGVPDLGNGAELAAALGGLQQLRLNQLAFYNYGLLPRPQLEKLAACLRA
jgi:hypothetical protein